MGFFKKYAKKYTFVHLVAENIKMMNSIYKGKIGKQNITHKICVINLKSSSVMRTVFIFMCFLFFQA